MAHAGLGIGAKIDMVYTLAHPHGPIQIFMPNASAKDRIGGTAVTRQDQQVIKKKMVNCVVFTNPLLPGVELFCSIKYRPVCHERKSCHTLGCFCS